MDHLCAVLEIKTLDEKGQFSGFASTYGNVDEGRDVVVAGAFKETMEEHSKAGTLPSMFYSHDMREPVGDYTEMKDMAQGLKVEGKLWVGEGIPKANQTYLMMKGTGAKGLSIGYGKRGPDGFSYDEKKQLRYLKNLDLYEVSPTPFPMNKKAKIVSIKSTINSPLSLRKADGSLITKRELEAALRDAGLSDREAKAFIANGYNALLPRDEADDVLIKKLDEATTTLFK